MVPADMAPGQSSEDVKLSIHDDVLFEWVCLLTVQLSGFYASHQALLHIITCSMGQHCAMVH
jgi:hypothetical protein